MKDWSRPAACWEPYLSWAPLIRQEQAAQAEQMNNTVVTSPRANTNTGFILNGKECSKFVAKLKNTKNDYE